LVPFVPAVRHLCGQGPTARCGTGPACPPTCPYAGARCAARGARRRDEGVHVRIGVPREADDQPLVAATPDTTGALVRLGH